MFLTAKHLEGCPDKKRKCIVQVRYTYGNGGRYVFKANIFSGGGIPFSIVLPKTASPVNADMVSVSGVHQKLEKGYADIKKGNVEDAASAFKMPREKH